MIALCRLSCILPMTAPAEAMTFPLGRSENGTIGGGPQIRRAVHAPGKRWSAHVPPAAGTPLRQHDHAGR